MGLWIFGGFVLSLGGPLVILSAYNEQAKPVPAPVWWFYALGVLMWWGPTLFKAWWQLSSFG